MVNDTSEESVVLADIDKTRMLFGDYDQNLILIQDEFDVDIIIRDGKLRIIGEKDNVSMVLKVIKIL